MFQRRSVETRIHKWPKRKGAKHSLKRGFNGPLALVNGTPVQPVSPDGVGHSHKDTERFVDLAMHRGHGRFAIQTLLANVAIAGYVRPARAECCSDHRQAPVHDLGCKKSRAAIQRCGGT